MIENKKSGFFYGYVIVIAAFIIQAISFGTYQCFGIFLKSFQADFGWSRAAISGATSLCFFLMGFFSVLSGRLTDRFGPRIVGITCGVLTGVGYLLLSRVTELWQLYLFYGLFVGAGMSFTDVGLLSTAARWFVRRRGLMTGIIKIGTGLGIMVIPLIASALILGYSRPIAYLALGILALSMTVPFASLLRKDPSKVHQYPDGLAQPQTIAAATGGMTLKEALRTPQLVIACIIYMTAAFCTQSIMVHIAPHTQDLGFSATNAATVLAIAGGVSMLGRFIMGAASDKISCRHTVSISVLVLASSLLWLQFARELWSLYLFAVVYGFAHGGFFSVISPMVAELFGMKAHGSIFGSIIFIGTMGGAIGPIIIGAIFDNMQTYQLAFLICLLVSSSGFVLSLLVKPIKKEMAR